MKKMTFILLVFAAASFLSSKVYSHCEIPCGIYGDQMRYDMMKENVTTIEKSMKMISELSKGKKTDQNYNQLVRWINNKEEHATKLMDIVSQYFLTQRIKPVEEKNKDDYSNYIEHLKLFHEMLIYAMKCKQTVDTNNTGKLSELIDKSKVLYFAAHKH